MAGRRTKALRGAEAIVTDTMGRLAESWGLKRNLGRAWAVLYLQGRALTADELRATLKLSTGAVSMTLRELQRWGVVRRLNRSGERRKLYIAEVDVWRVISRMLRARELVDLAEATDHLEGALVELRRDLQRATDGDRQELNTKIGRVEGLLDLVRIVSSMLRVLVTTARLDASVLATFRLGRGAEADRGDG